MLEPSNLILVVDDEPVILQTTSLILKTQDYEALTAEDGLAALEVLSTVRPRVLISDLTMPVWMDLSCFQLSGCGSLRSALL